MNRSQSLNAPPFFDGSNYVFWKVRMRAFLWAIDKSVWDSVKNGYVRPTIAKSEWDKAGLALTNADSKAINVIFCGVSTDGFHKISHVKTAKKVWTILETTYEGIVCYECNCHGHLKKECPNYLRGKGKVFPTTLSDSKNSNLDTKGECDSDGNYRAFMAITSVDSKDDLSNLVDKLGDNNLQEAYDSLLEDCETQGRVG
ncbi:hypothetical protein ACB092_05G113800 [Castanea dentata]